MKKKTSIPIPVDFSYLGITYHYANRKEAARLHDVNYCTFMTRLKAGYTYPQALEIEYCDRLNPDYGITIPDKNGQVKYRSLSEAARAQGLKPNTVHHRRYRGHSTESALGLDGGKGVRPTRRPIKIQSNGREHKFQMLKDVAEWQGIDYGLLISRLHRGVPILEALELIPSRRVGSKHEVEFLFDGKRYCYESIKEAAEANGESSENVRNRLAMGWSWPEALKLTPRDDGYEYSGAYSIYLVANEVNGMRYVGQTRCAIGKRWRNHVKEARCEIIVNPERLQKAILNFGEQNFEVSILAYADTKDAADALEKKYIVELNTLAPAGYNIRDGGSGLTWGKRIEIEGRKFRSVQEAAEFYNVCPSKARRRLAEGWTPKQAFELEEKEGPRNPVFFRGKKYKNGTALALAFGIRPQKYHRRISELGWSREEALELILRKK